MADQSKIIQKLSAENDVLKKRMEELEAVEAERKRAEDALMKDEEKNLEGIGGWLLLVAIGIVVTPIRLIINLALTAYLAAYSETFTTGGWEALTTRGSEAYSPLWAPLLIGEVLINCSFLLAWLYMAYLFFSKKSHFPKWYIGLAVFSLIFVIAIAFSFKLFFPNQPAFDAELFMDLMLSLFVVAVWVPYMLVSKRVKATFVK